MLFTVHTVGTRGTVNQNSTVCPSLTQGYYINVMKKVTVARVMQNKAIKTKKQQHSLSLFFISKSQVFMAYSKLCCQPLLYMCNAVLADEPLQSPNLVVYITIYSHRYQVTVSINSRKKIDSLSRVASSSHKAVKVVKPVFTAFLNNSKSKERFIKGSDFPPLLWSICLRLRLQAGQYFIEHLTSIITNEQFSFYFCYKHSQLLKMGVHVFKQVKGKQMFLV